MHMREAGGKVGLLRDVERAADQRQTVDDGSVVVAAMSECTTARSREGIQRRPHKLLQI